MKYCARCLYPENAKPTIIIDDEDGIADVNIMVVRI